MKIGVNFKLNLTKIDKSKIFHAKYGAKYAEFTSFIDIDEQDQYGNNGGITQSLNKEERSANVKAPFLGNSKVFWKDSQQGDLNTNTQEITQETSHQGESFDDDIPF